MRAHTCRATSFDETEIFSAKYDTAKTKKKRSTVFRCLGAGRRQVYRGNRCRWSAGRRAAAYSRLIIARGVFKNAVSFRPAVNTRAREQTDKMDGSGVRALSRPAATASSLRASSVRRRRRRRSLSLRHRSCHGNGKRAFRLETPGNAERIQQVK